MNRVLIVGSNGLIGQKILEKYLIDSNYDIIATSKSYNKFHKSSGYQFEILDITNTSAVNYIVERYNPTTIINTAALTQVDLCEEQKKLCWEINADGVKNLVNAANKINAHLIHFSSDFIFDGYNGPYKEDDKPNPLSYYGLSKLESENIVKENCKKWSIIRVILVYGIVKNMPRSNLVLWVKNNLENNKAIRVINDQFRMPTLAEDISKACFEIAKSKRLGIYHISGNEMMSILDIANKVADFFNLDKSLISPISSVELNEKAKRPQSTGFILDKAYGELNFKPTGFLGGLELFKNQLTNQLID